MLFMHAYTLLVMHLIPAVNTKKTPSQAILYVPPKMTKTEVKEYLTKIYNVSVLDVMTSTLLGK